MVELPTGTVTLLFSDIESSTALVRTLGRSWAGALERHRDLCRTSWASHGGHELGTEGDSFFVAFATATEALSAARDAQLALANAAWPENALLRVRVGLHTGTPQRHGEGYVGLDVHKAARVSAAAHGGQILLSDATAHLVRGDLRAEEGLLDLGEHRLKDIPHRVRLFQLIVPGLPEGFPLVRTQGGAGNLPAPMTPTVGRDVELDDMEASLGEGARLLTLTGPGGTGKTRLALTLAARVAPRYSDGVHFVPLESAISATDAWEGIARVLSVSADEAGPAVVEHASDKTALLVLDNLEQIEEADAVCRDLLAAAPRLSIVATSRRALHVAGEVDYSVPPLDLPSPTDENIGSFAAVQMFTHIAHAARRDFVLTPSNAAAVAKLCVALDGMPLALELVAARVKLLSVNQLLERVGRSLDVAHPDRSRPPRHHTMRETIDWSFRLLTPDQRVALMYLAVFESGADLEAVEAVLPAKVTSGSAALDLLYDLVDASLVLVSQTGAGSTRFSLLETVKQFAREQLAQTGRLAAAQQAHAQHFYDRAKTLVGSRHIGYVGQVDALLADADNVKAAVSSGAFGIRDVEWYVDGAVPAQHAIALFADVPFMLSRFGTALEWASAGLQLAGDDAGRAALHLVCSECLVRLDDPVLAIEHATLAAPGLSEPEGRDLPPWADPYRVAVEAEAWVLVACLELNDSDAARASIDRLLEWRRSGDEETDRAILDMEYQLAHKLGDFDRAHEFLERFAAAEALTALTRRRAFTINNLADLDMRLGRLRDAQARLAESVDLAFQSPVTTMFYADTFAAVVAADHPLVCARAHGALETFRRVEGLAYTASEQEEDERVLGPIRPLVAADDWQAAWERGGTEPIADLLREMAALPLPPE